LDFLPKVSEYREIYHPRERLVRERPIYEVEEEEDVEEEEEDEEERKSWRGYGRRRPRRQRRRRPSRYFYGDHQDERHFRYKEENAGDDDSDWDAYFDGLAEGVDEDIGGMAEAEGRGHKDQVDNQGEADQSGRQPQEDEDHDEDERG